MLGIGVLACVLASRSFIATGAWQSEDRLWRQDAAVAPRHPRPWVNRAVVALRRGDVLSADVWLAQAADLVPTQRPSDQRWSTDVIDATRARLLLSQGEFAAAHRLVAGADPASARGAVCAQVPIACAAGW